MGNSFGCMTQFKDKTAVIVEDDPFIAADLEGILQDLGVEVLAICTTVNEAMEAVQKIDADIFTLDYELGSETSDPVAKKLRTESKSFIVISGRVEQLAGQSNFSDTPLLSKPVDPSALATAIKKAVD